MSNVFENIQKALDVTLKQASLGGLPVSLQNDDYEPDISTPFLSSANLPSDVSQSSLGPSGQDLHQGTYQIDINYPTQTGRANLTKKADEINEVFKSGMEILWSTHCVRILGTSISGIRIGNAWSVLSVSVDWSTHSRRI